MSQRSEEGRLYIREGRNYIAVEGEFGDHLARENTLRHVRFDLSEARTELEKVKAEAQRLRDEVAELRSQEVDQGYTPHWSEADLVSIYTNGTATHVELTLAMEDLLHVRKALRAELSKTRSELEGVKEGWKAAAEAPHVHRGMKVSLRGFIGRVSEYLARKDQGGDAFQLREIQRHLCEVWRRRGEPGIVAEFGALYCLDQDGPIEEPEEDDEDETSTEGAQQ
jgi:hypothetical protein